MMGVAHLYEDFTTDVGKAQSVPPQTEDEIADARLEAFEQGYSSGWEDALKAHRDGASLLSDALRTSLERATLTRQEAFDQFIASAEALIGGIVTQVLPEMSQAVLGGHLRDILNKSLTEGLEQPVVLTVSPADYDTLLRLSHGWLPETARLVADPALKTGQADLKLGGTEAHIDLATVTQEVNAAVEAFFHVAKETLSNDG